MMTDNKEKTDFFDIFGDGFDRFDFPDKDIYRVTAGHGGESLLIAGSEKTALIDCGMAYCGAKTVDNLKAALKTAGKDSLDYVFLSHSHYDHIGALPYIKKAFPDACVCGSEHCSHVLKRPNAKKLMKSLGTAARDLYVPESSEEIPVEGLGVDRIVYDCEHISLGSKELTILETKGHTDCSISFALEPAGILFTSESTGILEQNFYVHTPILKSVDDAMRSLEKCSSYGSKYICLPHYGMLPQSFTEKYWTMFRQSCEEKINFIGQLAEKGLSKEEILKVYVDRYWTPDKQQEQPKEAYVINSGHIIDAFLRYLNEKKS